MSRTFNTMPGWVQLARRAGVRLPRDWREPVVVPAAGPDRRARQTVRREGRQRRREQLRELVGSDPFRAWVGPGPFGGTWPGLGRVVRVENRRMRHRDRQAVRQGRFDEPPPRPRHGAQWDYW